MAIEEIDRSLNQQYLTVNNPTQKLKVGILLSAELAPKFIHSILQDIELANFITVSCLIVENERPLEPILWTHGSRFPSPLKLNQQFLERRQSQLPSPFELADCMSLLPSQAQRIRLNDPSLLDSRPPEALDLILCFGSFSAALKVSSWAKQGSWLLEYGTRHREDASSALLSDMASGSTFFPIRLIQTDSTGRRSVVAQTSPGTNSRSTLLENFASVIWSGQHIVIQALHKLASRHPEPPAHDLDSSDQGPSGTLSSLSTAARSMQLVARIGGRRVVNRARRGTRDIEWQIGIRRSASHMLDELGADPLKSFRWLEPQEGHFWADPFLFKMEGRTWLFYEDYPYALERGLISCGVLDDQGTPQETRVILDRPYHLSYPNIFEWNGGIWMVPETADAGQIELYRCARFPDEWVLEKALLKLRATDPTVALIDGRWWLFVSPMPVRGQAGTTFLYSAESPLGPWIEAASSPISTDIRYARSAGHVFEHQGNFIRPAQNCASMYGYSVAFNRIDTINQQQYGETFVCEFRPDLTRGIQRVHTYNRLGDWQVIDGFRYRARTK